MKFNIKDAAGNVTNTIKANLEFVESNFEHYEEWIAPTPVEPDAEETARQWRDMELSATDYIVPLSDHPQRDAYILYRASLRAWPASDDFPSTSPQLAT